MSCYHRYYPHGCDWPPPDWYERPDYRPRYDRDDVVVVRGDEFVDDEERPRRRGAGLRRSRRYHDAPKDATVEVTAASLQARAAALHDELARIEEDLKKLTAEPGPPAEA